MWRATWTTSGRKGPMVCDHTCSQTTMDSFDNFQYDSASSYGGMGIVDDNSSVYTSNTNSHTPVDLDSLSISESVSSGNANGRHHHHHTMSPRIEDDFDAVLDDLKDEGTVDLPPHACRCGLSSFNQV